MCTLQIYLKYNTHYCQSSDNTELVFEYGNATFSSVQYYTLSRESDSNASGNSVWNKKRIRHKRYTTYRHLMIVNYLTLNGTSALRQDTIPVMSVNNVLQICWASIVIPLTSVNNTMCLHVTDATVQLVTYPRTRNTIYKLVLIVEMSWHRVLNNK